MLLAIVLVAALTNGFAAGTALKGYHDSGHPFSLLILLVAFPNIVGLSWAAGQVV